MQLKLEGVIYEMLYELLMVNDNFTVGQKLTQLEKKAKNRFYNMSDEEIYNTLKDTIKEDYYSDEF